MFLRRRAPEAGKKIRNYRFSDLRESSEGLLPEKHKRQWIVVIGELLHGMQILRLTETEMATMRKGKLFSGFFTNRP